MDTYDNMQRGAGCFERRQYRETRQQEFYITLKGHVLLPPRGMDMKLMSELQAGELYVHQARVTGIGVHEQQAKVRPPVRTLHRRTYKVKIWRSTG